MKRTAMEFIGGKALCAVVQWCGQVSPHFFQFSFLVFFSLYRHMRGFLEHGIIPTADCLKNNNKIPTETLMTTKSCQQRIIPFSWSHHVHLCYLLVSALIFYLFFFFFLSFFCVSPICLKQDQRRAGGFPFPESGQELPEVSWQRKCQVAAAGLLTCREFLLQNCIC